MIFFRINIKPKQQQPITNRQYDRWNKTTMSSLAPPKCMFCNTSEKVKTYIDLTLEPGWKRPNCCNDCRISQKEVIVSKSPKCSCGRTAVKRIMMSPTVSAPYCDPSTDDTSDGTYECATRYVVVKNGLPRVPEFESRDSAGTAADPRV